jgi:hypothetical protein
MHGAAPTTGDRLTVVDRKQRCDEKEEKRKKKFGGATRASPKRNRLTQSTTISSITMFQLRRILFLLH